MCDRHRPFIHTGQTTFATFPIRTPVRNWRAALVGVAQLCRATLHLATACLYDEMQPSLLLDCNEQAVIALCLQLELRISPSY